MKIGIFGGSFNPVHKKHIRILVDILDNNVLDKIYISIAGGTYTKKGLIDYNDRLEM
ncbi:MAG: nicotinate-nucleotide adenylyltransferase, partial [Clostridia bacterium]|nr:nicotinate-nucleotide adenylyltransferase [Clostridia bacterium]